MFRVSIELFAIELFAKAAASGFMHDVQLSELELNKRFFIIVLNP